MAIRLGVFINMISLVFMVIFVYLLNYFAQIKVFQKINIDIQALSLIFIFNIIFINLWLICYKSKNNKSKKMIGELIIFILIIAASFFNISYVILIILSLQLLLLILNNIKWKGVVGNVLFSEIINVNDIMISSFLFTVISMSIQITNDIFQYIKHPDMTKFEKISWLKVYEFSIIPVTLFMIILFAYFIYKLIGSYRRFKFALDIKESLNHKEDIILLNITGNKILPNLDTTNIDYETIKRLMPGSFISNELLKIQNQSILVNEKNYKAFIVSSDMVKILTSMDSPHRKCINVMRYYFCDDINSMGYSIDFDYIYSLKANNQKYKETEDNTNIRYISNFYIAFNHMLSNYIKDFERMIMKSALSKYQEELEAIELYDSNQFLITKLIKKMCIMDKIDIYYEVMKNFEYIIHYEAIINIAFKEEKDKIPEIINNLKASSMGSWNEYVRKHSSNRKLPLKIFDISRSLLRKISVEYKFDKKKCKYDVFQALTSLRNNTIGHGVAAYDISIEMLRDLLEIYIYILKHEEEILKNNKSQLKLIKCNLLKVRDEKYYLLSIVKNGVYEYMNYDSGELIHIDYDSLN